MKLQELIAKRAELLRMADAPGIVQSISGAASAILTGGGLLPGGFKRSEADSDASAINM